ncbi:aldo/keto reductase [Crenobacter sp. SG2303]|uniref:Aldo/keto reductase n=1 Tax=Crenobacter oryzisoli TaxID=3056844 RepID=A0ABT7XJ03_9NEIS|nr:aldo/keto reductase [Crenobacter sp. SG2303]MDN0073771.1 aldo/keto reductase [Crenobacter sp. SG2303]
MDYRKLGKTDLDVAPLAFGGNVFGWTLDETAAFRLLDEMVDVGLNFIDTADVYSSWVPGNQGGESETILGRWFKKGGKRKHIVLATKVGSEMAPDQKGLSKAYIRKAIEASLRRLQTDYIDLYQAHLDDPATPLEETLSAFDQLVREGKVRAIGASNYSAARLSEALAVSKENALVGYATIQPLYNLYDRADFEADLAPTCEEKGIVAISYFSLASGFLSGKYRSAADLVGHARGGMVGKYLDPRGLRILSALDEVANALGSTPATVALGWLMKRPAVAVPIASATSSAQLKALIAATELRLSQAEMDYLTEASA